MTNLERFLFYFLFFAIPLQARKILYYPGWYFNEWQAVTVYATDLILLILFIFWAVDNRHRKSVIHKYDYFLLVFLGVALVSVKNSPDFYSGIFLWLKLVEFAAFYFYLKTYAVYKFSFVKVLYALILGGSFQAVIAIVQFLKQGSLGLSLFGESVFGPQMIGVASFFIASGEKIIRAYGTTPHPNVLAAYLFLAIAAFYFVVFYSKSKHYDTPPYHSVGSKRYDSLIYHNIIKFSWISYPLMIFGLFFTFSRTIIFLFFVNFIARGLIINFIKKFKTELLTKSFVKQKILPIFLTTVAVTAAFAFLYWPEVQSRLTISGQEEAVQLRVFYNEASLKGGINLFGIGLGDFTGWLMEQNPNLPSYVYQPVHNIYLLVYSEIGIFGFVFFLLFLTGLIYEFIKKTKLSELWHCPFLLVTISFLFIGLFDHFFLTIQQGRFVFWLGLTILAIGDIIPTQSERS